MRQYETMVLLAPELSDEAVDEHVARFEKQITDGSGEVLEIERWGKKRLAYPILRQRHGIYYVITYKADSSVVEEIERGMRIDENTWRYMTVRMDPALLRKLEKNAKSAAAAKEYESRADDADRPSANSNAHNEDK